MMTREVGLPVCRALHAFGRGDYSTTIELLANLRPKANRFGGSHAQRDVLTQTLIVAALKGGQPKLARALARERIALKPNSASGHAFLARALAALGDNAAATSAEKAARVRRGLVAH